jgi:hypothetical protein
VTRLHPSRWPLGVWISFSLVAGLLRVQYTLGGFSFGTPVALLSGTWLGWRRAALVQAVAAALLVPIGMLAGDALPDLNSAAVWGFRVGLVAAAALAGLVATADGNGAHPTRGVRLAVFGAAGGTIGLVTVVAPEQSSGVMFALIFLLAGAIAVFYAYRMVPEPGRVIGYAFCLLPYYTLGVGWDFMVARFAPATAALAGIPDQWHDVVFHAYLAQLPSELIALVVISYLVCALDRGGAERGPMAIGASR